MAQDPKLISSSNFQWHGRTDGRKIRTDWLTKRQEDALQENDIEQICVLSWGILLHRSLVHYVTWCSVYRNCQPEVNVLTWDTQRGDAPGTVPLTCNRADTLQEGVSVGTPILHDGAGEHAIRGKELRHLYKRDFPARCEFELYSSVYWIVMDSF